MQPLSQKSDVIAEVPKTFFLMASSGQLKYRPLRNVPQLPSSTTRVKTFPSLIEYDLEVIS